ncbi:Lrp/AsnC family transcriptional regulator [Chloroflexota bacterium]
MSTEVTLPGIKQRLLNQLQSNFPLVRRPFASLGVQLDVSEGEIIKEIEELKAEGIIRQIGPLFDTRKLGFRTTLVAVKVGKSELENAVQVIIDHPGVSHAYERNHDFNLWFTLAFPATVDIDSKLKEMFASVDIDAVFSLPATRLFKLRAYFDTSGGGQAVSEKGSDINLNEQAIELSPADKMIINAIQEDLSLVVRPFYDIAAGIGMKEDEFLERCCSLLSRGIIRRFSANINHRRVGFVANAMACWIVPEEQVDSIGRKLAALQEVSHCYERKTNAYWKHNLFAMIHQQTREECQQIADKVAAETALTDYMLLYSTREMKKTRVKYLV